MASDLTFTGPIGKKTEAPFTTCQGRPGGSSTGSISVGRGAGRRPLKTPGNFLMLAERWMSPTALKAAFKTSKRISPKRNPHFSPGRWWHDEKQFIFSTLIGSI